MERLTENIEVKLKDETINACIVKNFNEDDMKYNMAQSQIEIIDKVINKLGEYEDTGLTPKEIIELEKENEQLKEIVEFRNTGRASGKSVTEKVLHFNDLQKENEQLTTEKNNIAIEKLEDILNFIYSNKWTNIELCIDESPLKIIRNKLNTMISNLKGE